MQENPGGHAVVLMRCSPIGLTFMNSWGKEFANGGFFNVQKEEVLHNMKFYDVYWLESDLTPNEKRAYGREYSKKCREIAQKYPSILNLHFNCPKCHVMSLMKEFIGHILEAECPKCHRSFIPTNEQFMQCLYIKSQMLPK